MKSDLAERSNFYCWHCGFELKNTCPRCGYGMTDTAYRDAEEESNEESDEDNAQWEDKDYEDVMMMKILNERHDDDMQNFLSSIEISRRNNKNEF